MLVMGCGADQVCQYDENGSAFTQSLAKVLDARNPARTLKEVVDEVAKDMTRRSRQSQGDPQDPVVRYPEVLRLAGHVQVCDGDERAAAWRKAVEASPLLAQCDHPHDIQAVVAKCARHCGAAEDTLRARTGLDDLWTDQDLPFQIAVAALLGLALVLLLYATMWMSRAQAGPPGEEIMLTGENLEQWTQDEVRKVSRALYWVPKFAAASVLIVATAVAFTWFAPARDASTTPLVRVIGPSGQSCGELVGAADRQLVIRTATATTLIPLAAVNTITTVTACG